jgi:hypothetical protein
MIGNAISESLRLKAGEFVEVRTKEEILATLDAKGCLEELPFMPEMFKYCGSRQRVFKRAHKTCDSVNWTGGRRMKDAVHLETIRCDGQAHGGCQAQCLIFWKEAWLKRASESSIGQRGSVPASGARGLSDRGCTELAVVEACKKAESPPGDPVYVCQATQLLSATSPLPWWDSRQYLEDYGSRNVDIKWMFIVFAHSAFILLRSIPWVGMRIKRLYNGIQRLRGKPRHPRTWGRIEPGKPTPSIELNLQPGELVRVKSFDAILDTITQDYYNRGMKWDAEMAPYCGGTYPVKTRVKQIIDEATGKMMNFKNPCLILEGVVCQAKYSNCRLFCPRSTYAYWREIWLERASPMKDAAKSDAGERSHTSKS